jgi:hypothetical protein
MTFRRMGWLAAVELATASHRPQWRDCMVRDLAIEAPLASAAFACHLQAKD